MQGCGSVLTQLLDTSPSCSHLMTLFKVPCQVLSLGPQTLFVALNDLPQGSKSSAQSPPASPNLEPRAHFSLINQELGL